MLEAAENSWTLAEAAHLMNRAGFGTSPDELYQIHHLGRHAAVAALLSPISFDQEPVKAPEWTRPENIKQAVRDFIDARRKSKQKMPGMSPDEAAKERQRLRRLANRKRRENQVSLVSWWFALMVKGKSPLREKMTFFWHDHFATSIKKVKQPGLMFQQNQLLRRHSLGNFRELTAAIASDPAMMVYLDTSNSSKANPNENFARELLELFTLGEGHYSEADIANAARAFTGYRLDRRTGMIRPNRGQHDFGDKTFLGETGKFDGPDIIRLIFAQKRPAEFLAEKLWLWFADDQPDPAAIADLGKCLLKHDYQIKPALKRLFESKAFYDPARRRNQIKSPIDFVAQMTKQLEVEPMPTPMLLQSLEKLGQVPFLPPNVAGWNEGRAFINTNTLLSRYNIAGIICKGNDRSEPGMKARNRRGDRLMRLAKRRWKGPNYQKLAPPELRQDPIKLVVHLSARLFQDKVPTDLKQQFLSYAKSKVASANQLEDRHIAELIHLMMSTPQYQLC